MPRLLLLVALTALCGCSNRAVYDNLQINQRQQCAQLPPTESEKCMRNTGKSYPDYARERGEVVER